MATKAGYRPSWHHRLLAEHLDAVVRGECKRLMVFMPPQHGKSELVSRRLPAFALGVNSQMRILSASYAHGLAAAMNRDVQRIIDSDDYHALFPKTALSGKRVKSTSAHAWLRNNEEFEVVDRGGYYKCAGVGGGLTGKSADLAIIDDPYKDYKEAMSPAVRLTVQEWYTSVVLTRMSKDGAIVLCHTRWHDEDLAGYLLATEPERWTVLSLPAIAEGDLHPRDPRSDGESLWPDYLDERALAERKQTTTAHQWSALYQQRPTAKGGELFRPYEWIGADRYVTALPSAARFVWYWDNAAGTDGRGARSAGCLMAEHDGRYYIVRIEAGHWSPAEREARKRALASWARDTYGPRIAIWCEQEPGSGGKEQFLATAKNLAGFAVHADRVTGSKELRAEPFAGQMEIGQVYLYVGDGDAWVKPFMDELESFPRGRTKDMVDAASGAFAKLCEGPKRVVRMINGGEG